MRRTNEEAAQTRQAILDAALTVFSREGYQASRLQDIANAAGVTRGAIYHHFGNKVELYITLIEKSSERISAIIEQAIEEGGSFQELAARVLVDFWTSLEENPQLAKVVELYNLRIGYVPELANFDRRREEGAEKVVNYIAGFISEAIENGELSSDLDPMIAARAFMAYQNGIRTLWLTKQNAFSLKECAPALAAIFVRGLWRA